MTVLDRLQRRRVLILVVLGTVLMAGCSQPATSPMAPSSQISSPSVPAASAASSEASATPTSRGELPTIRVHGNGLVDGAGNAVVLRGANRASGEYMCVDGAGVFHGPTDQASIYAMLDWGINAVRLPLNSACWLDIEHQLGTRNPQFVGRAYQDAIAAYVDRLSANGLYVILDQQWTGCGEAQCFANWLKPMPDRPFATQFWTSVAERFKSYDNVLFDLFNEPDQVDWDCWRSGGCQVGPNDQPYIAEGMQQMVDAIRSAGATGQPILLSGLAYSNDLSGWLEHLPKDASNSLVASVHLYNFSWPCPGNEGTASAAIECLSSGANALEPIAAVHPVVFGELGQSGCATDFVEPVLEWIGRHGYGVLGWAWNVADCSTFPALITNYDGTPTAFGRAFQASFRARASDLTAP